MLLAQWPILQLSFLQPAQFVPQWRIALPAPLRQLARAPLQPLAMKSVLAEAAEASIVGPRDGPVEAEERVAAADKGKSALVLGWSARWRQ